MVLTRGLYGIKLVIDDKGYPTVKCGSGFKSLVWGETCTTDFRGRQFGLMTGWLKIVVMIPAILIVRLREH